MLRLHVLECPDDHALFGERRICGGLDRVRVKLGVADAEEAQKRADAFRDDYAGSLRQMVRQLFHKDVDPAMLADTEQRMAHTSPAAAHSMFLSLAGYVPSESARLLTVPLRAINGDLYPTDTESVRSIKPDFDVMILTHVGHCPMLERPEEFDRLVSKVIRSLVK